MALESIEILPSNPAVLVGDTQRFTAIGRYTDGSTQDITDLCEWVSSNLAVASISNSHIQILFDIEFEDTFEEIINGFTPYVVDNVFLEVNPEYVLFGVGSAGFNGSEESPALLMYQTNEEFVSSCIGGFTASMFFKVEDEWYYEVPPGTLIHLAQVFIDSGIDFTVKTYVQGLLVEEDSMSYESVEDILLNAVGTGFEVPGVMDGIQLVKGNLWVEEFTPPSEPLVSTAIATAISNGQSTITASYDGKVGTTNITVGASASVDITDVHVVNIQPSAFTIKAGSVVINQSEAYIVRRGFCYIENTVPTPVPTISDAVVDQYGVFGSDSFSLGIGVEPNTEYVVRAFTVTNGGSIDYSESIIVSTIVLISLEVTPITPVIAIGESIQLQVLGTYSNGSIVDLTNIVEYDEVDYATFTPVYGVPGSFNVDYVDTNIVVTVNATGLVTGISGGIAKILVTAENYPIVTDLVVVQPAEGSIDIGGSWNGGLPPWYIPPPLVGVDLIVSSPMLIGNTQKAYLLGHNGDSPQTYEIINPLLASWVSSDVAVATVDDNGLIVAVARGVTFIKTEYVLSSPEETFINVVMLRVEEKEGNILENTTYQYIPLQPLANQSLRITVPVDGSTSKSLNLFLRWNKIAEYWEMSISDILGNNLVDSVPLLSGIPPTYNLLRKYAHLNIGSCYIVNISNSNLTKPDDKNLGIDFAMFWGYTENG